MMNDEILLGIITQFFEEFQSISQHVSEITDIAYDLQKKHNQFFSSKNHDININHIVYIGKVRDDLSNIKSANVVLTDKSVIPLTLEEYKNLQEILNN